MIKLIPDWAKNYSEYLNSIRSRNIWLIHIRYAAVLMLLAIILASIYILKLDLTETQITTLSFVTLIILLYNILLHRTRNYLDWSDLKFNPLHLSLVQIILDLLALSIIVYITGSIETPLYMLFIFHMIIGSLILPPKVIFTIASVLVISFSALVLGEYFYIIPHHHIAKIHVEEYAQNINFILTTLAIFIFTIYTTVAITSRIAKKLYKREQQLKESLEKIDELEVTKQTYIMGVVHEIKSPIVAAQSIVELVKNGYLGEINDKIQKKLERALLRNDEALNLINNILRISKLKLIDDFTIVALEIKEFLNLIVDSRKDLLDEKNIKVSVDASKLRNPLIHGDKILYELVFSNIIGNAIKYTANDGKIFITLTNDKDRIIVEVSDNGIGIPKGETEMAFMQFFRASNLKNKKVDGSGLGLSLVKEIIDRFKGEINITSPSQIGNDDHPGTTVLITLPMNPI